MAKQSGLGDNFYVDGYNVSGDIGSIDISTPRETLGVTGLPSSAQERLLSKKDGKFEWTAYFNPATNQAHDRFNNLPQTDVVATYFRGTAIGNAAIGMVAKQLNYDGSRGDDGSFTFKVEADANGYGGNWGEQLTAGIVTQGSAGALTSLDYGAAVGTTNFGLQAFLQVFAFTGTNITVAIQSSTDNGAGDAFTNVTGAVFTAATGVTSERIATANNQAVERYLRVNTTGTFSNAQFAVIVCRNLALTNF